MKTLKFKYNANGRLCPQHHSIPVGMLGDTRTIQVIDCPDATVHSSVLLVLDTMHLWGTDTVNYNNLRYSAIIKG